MNEKGTEILTRDKNKPVKAHRTGIIGCPYKRVTNQLDYCKRCVSRPDVLNHVTLNTCNFYFVDMMVGGKMV